jgi:phosphatidate cytidylyltransferase
VVVLFVWLGGWPFFALGVLAAIVGTHEFCSIVRRAGYRPLCLLTIMLSVTFLFDAQMALAGTTLPGGTVVSRLAISATILGSLIYLVLREDDARRALPNWAFVFAGALYIGWLLRYYLLLRGLDAHLDDVIVGLPGIASIALERGVIWLGLVIGATWACDTTAYFAGSSFGRRRLLPRISPNKTWEGTIAGVVAAGLVGSLAAPIMGMPVAWSIGLGLAIGVAAVFGDLSESLIKRSGHVKDASSLIPGHGGLLDRLDSMLFTGVTAYYYLALTQAALSL